MSTERIDVDAVLEAAMIDLVIARKIEVAGMVVEARAALAELINSTGELNYDLDHLLRDDDDEFIEIHLTVGGLKRIHAALARVQGGAA